MQRIFIGGLLHGRTQEFDPAELPPSAFPAVGTDDVPGDFYQKRHWLFPGDESPQFWIARTVPDEEALRMVGELDESVDED